MPEKQNFLEKLKNTMTHSEGISIKFKEVLFNNFVNDKRLIMQIVSLNRLHLTTTCSIVQSFFRTML